MSFDMAITVMRVFRNFYQCDECPNEWSDEMLTQGVSWCPCCDLEREPYSSVELWDDTEVDDDELQEAA